MEAAAAPALAADLVAAPLEVAKASLEDAAPLEPTVLALLTDLVVLVVLDGFLTGALAAAVLVVLPRGFLCGTETMRLGAGTDNCFNN